jgi:hypothetical protein
MGHDAQLLPVHFTLLHLHDACKGGWLVTSRLLTSLTAPGFLCSSQGFKGNRDLATTQVHVILALLDIKREKDYFHNCFLFVFDCETGSYYVAQADLEFVGPRDLLPQPPE